MGPEGTTGVAILCGGRGTRLQERTRSIPKPLVEIGDHPILWHVIGIYAAQGCSRFVLCTGYLGDQIEEFVSATDWPPGLRIECVDTGLETPTGGRLSRVRDRFPGTFFATYADGVADIDLGRLLEHHRSRGGAATMTVVRPEMQFGVTDLGDDGHVIGFREKPRSEQWINGGFFCFEPGVFGYLHDDAVLERESLERLAGEGQLFAYAHDGFWECMDTYKDAVHLGDLWSAGAAPWKVWS